MHIPDGFVSLPVNAAAFVAAGGACAYAVRRARQELGERQVPLLGVVAAAIFAGQMLNFSVAGGTSGHLLGAVLAAILLGPWSAAIVMTTVLAVQCLFFQDGGITALGANVLNMAVIGVFAGYAAYRLLGVLFPSRTGKLAATFLAAWLSVMASALAAAVELALSGALPLNVVLPAMAYWHALIGVGEGLITTAAVAYATRTNLVPAPSLAGKA